MYLLKFMKMKLIDKVAPKLNNCEKAESTLILTNLQKEFDKFGESILEAEQFYDQKVSKIESRELFLANIVSIFN